MKRYVSLIIVFICCLFVGNYSFWSSVCDSRKTINNKTYTECINREYYNNEINKYNNALNKHDYVKAIAAIEKAKKYGSQIWVNISDLNDRIQDAAAYLCSAYAEKEEYYTALTYCKKSLAIYEEASVLYNAWFVCSKLWYWEDSQKYLNRAKKKSLDSSLSSQIDKLLVYVNWEKQYADLKNTWKTNDKYWYYQYYMQKINIFDAWDKLPKKKKQVIIAVIDDWININHPEFTDKIWINNGEKPWDWVDNDKNGYVDDYNGWDFVNNTNNVKPSWNHGTIVAWVIASEINNNIWIAWIVPDVKIMSLNVFSSNWKSKSNYIVDAIEYAIDNGADIINLSLGWEQYSYSNYYDSVIKKAYDKWIVIVISAWNGDELSQDAWVNTTVNKLSPVCNESDKKVIFWVWALAKDWTKTKWSNYWSCVDFYMYWEDIYTTTINSQWEPYIWANGTSLSAPIVAWIIGLWYNKYWKIDPDIIYDSLKKSQNGYVIDASKYLDNLSLSQWELWQAIDWMINKWFTKAKNADEFKIDRWITRAEASKFFVTYANLFHKNTITNSYNDCIFSDINNAPSDLRSYVTDACRYGLLVWKNWKFVPNNKLTNAQAVTVFMRMYGWKKDESWTYFADKYYLDAYKLWIIDGMIMWKQKNYEKSATRWDIAILLYRWIELMKK